MIVENPQFVCVLQSEMETNKRMQANEKSQPHASFNHDFSYGILHCGDK